MKLLFKERLVIEKEIAIGRGVREIARILGRNHSVVSRELTPDKDQGQLPYSARRAEMRAERKIRHGRKRKLDKDNQLKDFVAEHLTKDWSPEQIAGRISEQPPTHLVGRSITFETIYQFVYSPERGLDGKLLYHHLRCGQPQRVRRYNRKPSKLKIPERVSIHQRPELTGHGHWETDTLFGRQNQPASVQYEKKSQLVRIHKLVNQTARETREAIEYSLATVPGHWRQSVTFDNGTENYEHRELGIPTFFCDPYSAWQKGGVENMNKLIRQYIPKKADLNQYTDRDIHDIQERLNNRPRKGLNYRTPNEILTQSGAFVSRT